MGIRDSHFGSNVDTLKHLGVCMAAVAVNYRSVRYRSSRGAHVASTSNRELLHAMHDTHGGRTSPLLYRLLPPWLDPSRQFPAGSLHNNKDEGDC